MPKTATTAPAPKASPSKAAVSKVAVSKVAVSNGGTFIAAESAPATREGVLLFARLMTAIGSVTTFGTSDPDLTGTCIATHVPDAPGYTVAFLSAADGTPEVRHYDFDLGERASEHLLHSDGLGLTLTAPDAGAWIHCRLSGDPLSKS